MSEHKNVESTETNITVTVSEHPPAKNLDTVKKEDTKRSVETQKKNAEPKEANIIVTISQCPPAKNLDTVKIEDKKSSNETHNEDIGHDKNSSEDSKENSGPGISKQLTGKQSVKTRTKPSPLIDITSKVQPNSGKQKEKVHQKFKKGGSRPLNRNFRKRDARWFNSMFKQQIERPFDHNLEPPYFFPPIENQHSEPILPEFESQSHFYPTFGNEHISGQFQPEFGGEYSEQYHPEFGGEYSEQFQPELVNEYAEQFQPEFANENSGHLYPGFPDENTRNFHPDLETEDRGQLFLGFDNQDPCHFHPNHDNYDNTEPFHSDYEAAQGAKLFDPDLEDARSAERFNHDFEKQVFETEETGQFHVNFEFGPDFEIANTGQFQLHYGNQGSRQCHSNFQEPPPRSFHPHPDARQFHPYRKRRKRSQANKQKGTFDMAYLDMYSIMDNLTTQYFRQNEKTPEYVPGPFSVNPGRFVNYSFEREEEPQQST